MQIESSLRIAVVMCTYNGERFVAEQISSIRAQSRLPDKLVVDDSSTDSTWHIVQHQCALAAELGIEVVVRCNARNLGYVANFGYALSLANSDLLFLNDQGDIWRPDKIERMVQEFMRRPELELLHTDARLVDASGRDMVCRLFEALEITSAELKLEHEGNAFDVLLRRNIVTGATTAARRDALGKAFPCPRARVHDEWLALSCPWSGRIDCLEDARIDRRRRDANHIGVRRRNSYQRLRWDLPRRAFMQRVEQKLESVLEHLHRRDGQAPPGHMAARVGWLRHARVRAHLPQRPGAGLKAVLREASLGGYSRYSSGSRSVVADIHGLD